MSEFSKRIVLQIGGVLFAGLFIIATITVYIASLERQVTHTEQAWLAYSQKAAKTADAVSKLNSAMGYGGFIHHFKNFVLRGDPKYAISATESFTTASAALAEIEQLGADQQASIAPLLAAIKRMVQEYRTNLSVIFQNKESVGVQELDAMVRVDDTAAFAALESLRGIVGTLALEREKASAVEISAIKRQIDLGFWMIAIVVLSVIYMVAHFRKLDNIRGAERSAKEQADAILDGSPEAMLLINENGRIIRANQEASVLFGYDLAQLTGLRVNELVPEELREVHSSYMHGFSNTGAMQKMTRRSNLEALRKDGTRVAVDISLRTAPISNVPHTVVAIRDVTEQRKLELALIEARESAERANETKSAFLASMSHEIRTPLTGLLGMADLLETTTLSEKQYEFVDTIKSSGRHLEEVLNDILDLSKLQAGQMKITQGKFEAKKLVRLVEAIYGSVAADKGVQLGVSVSDEANSKVLVSDVVRLRQVLLNLVGNAVKFTEKGSIDVSLELRSAPDRGSELSLVVRDTGIGIPEEKIQGLFDPFVQVEDHKTKTRGGTGLGLAICKKIVELLGGTITMTSQLGHGTMVSVLVPVKTEEDRRGKKAKNAGSVTNAQAKPAVQGGKKSILVADDSAINRRLVQGVLSKWGHDLDFAVDGQEAIEKMMDKVYDVVLLDIHMPKFDGSQVLEKITAAGRRHGKFVAFTADVMTTSVDAYNEQGFDGVLSKPINWDDLRGFLDDVPPFDRRSLDL